MPMLLLLSFLRTASCSDGDMRVVGGDSEYDGKLEVCFNQRWGTVNGDGWSSVLLKFIMFSIHPQCIH